jgi:GH43 family beta-xylosidase
MPSWQWAIDGTVAHINGQDYFVYSGWPQDNPGLSDRIQCLFVLKMAGPTAVTGNPVCICQPTESWERPEQDRGINEGPQWLASPDGSWQGIVYSCDGSWTRDYKMNTLQFLGGDPLSPSSWRKSMTPLLQARGPGQGAPYGPGHSSFIRTPEGETWAIYHGTDREDDGWNNRKARVQRLLWTPNGPDMKGVVGTLVTNEAAFLAVSPGVPPVSSKKDRAQAPISQPKKKGVKRLLEKVKKRIKS